jgi:hypothetical protein
VFFYTFFFARFTHNTRRSHEKALERIGLYLKLTQDKGLILRPTMCEESSELPIDCYVDADFAGMWGYEDHNDPSCVKSRTGYVISIANCPVIWKSKLQSCIASSAMEAEYNILSMAMSDVLTLRNLAIEISKGVGMPGKTPTTFKTTVWEASNGDLKLAILDPGRTTPRSKAFGVRYHCFRSKLKPDEIEVKKIAGIDKRADFLTKALRAEAFIASRKLTCGW